MPKRTKTPEDVVTEVLTASLRRCCLCFALRGDGTEKKGQVAHLDQDPSNAALDNLAFLCFDHHDQYDSKTSQSKGLTIDEVKRHRAALLAHLAVRGGSPTPSDDEILATITAALDRPAFRTRFHSESSLPRFREAIAETIATINTGTTPQGTRQASKLDLRDPAVRAKVDRLVEHLVGLRAAFEKLIREGAIRHCSCSDADCPSFMLEPHATHEMDKRRHELLRLAHELSPRAASGFYDIP